MLRTKMLNGFPGYSTRGDEENHGVKRKNLRDELFGSRALCRSRRGRCAQSRYDGRTARRLGPAARPVRLIHKGHKPISSRRAAAYCSISTSFRFWKGASPPAMLRRYRSSFQPTVERDTIWFNRDETGLVFSQ